MARPGEPQASTQDVQAAPENGELPDTDNLRDLIAADGNELTEQEMAPRQRGDELPDTGVLEDLEAEGEKPEQADRDVPSGVVREGDKPEAVISSDRDVPTGVHEGDRPWGERSHFDAEQSKGDLSSTDLRTRLGLPADRPGDESALALASYDESAPFIVGSQLTFEDQLRAQNGMCPSGHRLISAVPGEGICDGCARSIEVYEEVKECQTCDWFLCKNCVPPVGGYRKGNVTPIEVMEGAGPEIAAVYERTPTPPDTSMIRAQLFAKLCGEAETPLELATLAQMRVYEKGDKGYSMDEMMELVEWLETKLAPPKAQQPERALWAKFGSQRRSRILALVVLALICALVVISCFAGAMLEAFKVAAAEESGLITVAGPDGRRPAGLADAVRLHGLAEYPSLAMDELRHAQDVVLSHDGAFHFYRVAGVSRSSDGGVRVTAADRSVVRVAPGGREATLLRPFRAEQVLDLNETLNATRDRGAWASAGAFRVRTLEALPPSESRSSGGAPAIIAEVPAAGNNWGDTR